MKFDFLKRYYCSWYSNGLNPMETCKMLINLELVTPSCVGVKYFGDIEDIVEPGQDSWCPRGIFVFLSCPLSCSRSGTKSTSLSLSFSLSRSLFLSRTPILFLSRWCFLSALPCLFSLACEGVSQAKPRQRLSSPCVTERALKPNERTSGDVISCPPGAVPFRLLLFLRPMLPAPLCKPRSPEVADETSLVFRAPAFGLSVRALELGSNDDRPTSKRVRCTPTALRRLGFAPAETTWSFPSVCRESSRTRRLSLARNRIVWG